MNTIEHSYHTFLVGVKNEPSSMRLLRLTMFLSAATNLLFIYSMDVGNGRVQFLHPKRKEKLKISSLLRSEDYADIIDHEPMVPLKSVIPQQLIAQMPKFMSFIGDGKVWGGGLHSCLGLLS